MLLRVLLACIDLLTPRPGIVLTPEQQLAKDEENARQKKVLEEQRKKIVRAQEDDKLQVPLTYLRSLVLTLGRPTAVSLP